MGDKIRSYYVTYPRKMFAEEICDVSSQESDIIRYTFTLYGV
jgi:hypothetical protein